MVHILSETEQIQDTINSIIVISSSSENEDKVQHEAKVKGQFVNDDGLFDVEIKVVRSENQNQVSRKMGGKQRVTVEVDEEKSMTPSCSEDGEFSSPTSDNDPA